MNLREELRLSQRELVAVLKPVYPGISTAAVSLAERQKVTGVQFTPKAVNAARELTGHVKTPPKRKHPYRVTLWITADMKKFLQGQAERSNINDLLRSVILQAMKEGGFHAAKD